MNYRTLLGGVSAQPIRRALRTAWTAATATRTRIIISALLAALLVTGTTYGSSQVFTRPSQQQSASSRSGQSVAGSTSQQRIPSSAVPSTAQQGASQQSGSNQASGTGDKPTTASKPANAANNISSNNPWYNCPAEFQAIMRTGGQTPPAINKDMGSRTVTIPYNQSTGSYRFTNPDGVNIGFASAFNMWQISPNNNAITAGRNTPSPTVTLETGTWTVRYVSPCYQYSLALTIVNEQPPAVFAGVSYDAASRSVLISGNRPLSDIEVSYTIGSCYQLVGSADECTGVIIVGGDNFVAVPVDTYMPELAEWQAAHGPSTVSVNVRALMPGYEASPSMGTSFTY